MEIYPITYKGKVYHKKDCDDIFEQFYTCADALTNEGMVYIADGTYVAPDGSMNHTR